MQQVRNGNVSLHVRDDGAVDAPVIMFSNSLGSDLRIWDPLLEHLSDDYRIVRYDKRGHGLSDCPAAPYTMEQLVDDASAIASALHLKNINFIGLSIGGLIGQGIASVQPDLIRSLILIDTAAKIGTTQMWQERIAALRKEGLPAMSDLILDRWFSEPYRHDGACLPLMRNMLTRTPLEGYVGCCEAIANADFRESTARLQLPVMAIVGEHDSATPPLIVEQTAKLCNAEFHQVKGAAHMPCVDQAQTTAELINEFLLKTHPT